MEGVHRFLARAWRLFQGGLTEEAPTAEQLRQLHSTIKRVRFCLHFLCPGASADTDLSAAPTPEELRQTHSAALQRVRPVAAGSCCKPMGASGSGCCLGSTSAPQGSPVWTPEDQPTEAALLVPDDFPTLPLHCP